MTNPIGLISMYFARPFGPAHFDALETMKTAGFDFIELLVPEPDELDLAETRKVLSDAGLGVRLAARVNPSRDLTSSDADARAAGLAYCHWCVDVAGELGANTVGGPLYGGPLVFAGRAPHIVSEELRRDREGWCLEGLAAAGDYAARAGIRLAVEPLNRFETDILNTTRQAVELIDALAQPAVGLLLDTFHMNMEDPDVAAAIRHAGHRLILLQANENHRGIIGTGHLDWPAIGQALAAVDYRGPITLEPLWRGDDALALTLAQWRPPRPGDWDALVASTQSFRRLLAEQGSGR